MSAPTTLEDSLLKPSRFLRTLQSSKKKAKPPQSKIFIKQHHKNTKKHLPAQVFFRLYVADLDAGRFCRGYNAPLGMTGIALDRYLPGLGAMLATMFHVFLQIINLLTNNFIC
jgi:hypothetical protein